MNLRLMLKESIKDFKNKIELYLSFTIFLAVCLSLIIGMFSFTFSFSSNYSNVFDNGYNRNAVTRNIHFVDHNAKEDEYDLNIHYVRTNERFENYIFDSINRSNLYRKLSDSELKSLKSQLDLNRDSNNLISYIGKNQGFINNQLVNKYEDEFNINEKELFNENNEIKKDLNSKQLELVALKKLYNFLLEPSQTKGFENYIYGLNIINKYIIEKKLNNYNDKLSFGVEPPMIGEERKATNLNSKILISYMPIENWMRDRTDLIKSHQFDENPMQKLYITERMDIDKIDKNILENMNYIYVEPSFLHGNKLKLGDDLTWFNGYKNVTFKIIGTAISKNNFYGRATRGMVFIPPTRLNYALSGFNSKDNAFTGISYTDIYFKDAKQNTIKANELLKNLIYEDFDIDHVLGGVKNNPLIPLGDYEIFYKLPQTNLTLYKILSYAIGGGALLLLFAVFWFITNEGIKMQKNTLWFLKSIGQKNFALSMITTLGIMVPFILSAILSIFGSIGVSAIMNSAVSNTYSFFMPIWNFGLNSLFVLLVIALISFIIFFIMNISIISGKALSLDSRSKVGIFTKTFMKVKPHLKMNASMTIGTSFMVQNLFKNLLTFILLLLSFSIVLFSMQFNSSAKYSASSYERRNEPYKSIMMNKMNNADSIKFNEKFLSKNIGLSNNDIEDAKEFIDYQELQNYSLGRGYETSVINKYNDSEEEIAKQLDLKSINTNDEFNNAILNSILPGGNIKNYYLSSNYVKNTLLNNSKDSKEIVSDIFKFDISKKLINYVKQNKNKIIDSLIELGLINKGNETKVSEFIDRNIDKIETIIENAKKGLSNKIETLREAASGIVSQIKTFDKNISIYFNKSIIPRDSESYYSTNLIVKGINATGIGLDKRLDKTYKIILDPYKEIEEINDEQKIETAFYDNGKTQKNVHIIHGYISGNLSDNLNIKKGDIIQTSATGWSMSNGEIQDVYIKVDGVVKESSAFKEIYFNKKDLIIYLKQSFINNWSNNAPLNYIPYSVDKFNNPNKDKSEYRLFESILKRIDSKDGEFLLNNAVYGKELVPYSMRHFTFNSKIGSGRSLLEYVNLPFFNYESNLYPVDFGNNIYIFKIVTENFMNVIQPISTTVNRFIILLLILTGVVAIILINLILLENRKIIILFKSMGYRKRQVNIYLTFGYIVSTVLALAAGILVSYFGISVASKVTISMIGISLFFVWSWQFILTAALMASIFIGVTISAVSLYTNYQKPKEAFNAL